MPELPEVETVARQLAPVLEGRVVSAIKVHDLKIAEDFTSLHGQAIRRVYRLGKQIVLEVGSEPLYLSVHLRMTGRLIWQERRGSVQNLGSYLHNQEATERSLRATIVCEGGVLQFYDTRRFGTLVLVRELAKITPQGIEPFSEDFTVAKLQALTATSKQALKQWLLRQDRIVGLGNIYACEILYAAKLSPFLPACAVQRKEVTRLHAACLRILQKAIDNCGTTFSDFQDSSGSLGNYQQFLKVYGREGLPCRRCHGAKIERVMHLGRSTYFCPSCQRLK